MALFPDGRDALRRVRRIRRVTYQAEGVHLNPNFRGHAGEEAMGSYIVDISGVGGCAAAGDRRSDIRGQRSGGWGLVVPWSVVCGPNARRQNHLA